MLLRHLHFDHMGSIIKQTLLEPVSDFSNYRKGRFIVQNIRRRTKSIFNWWSFIWDFSVWCIFVEIKEMNIKSIEEHHRRLRILSSVFLAYETLRYASDWHKAWMANLSEILTFIGPCIVIYSYSTTNKMHLFLKLFILVKRSTCFGRSFPY
jgi:hypothetical protein